MAPIRTAPCDWPLVDELTCSALDDLAEYGLRDAIVGAAVEMLWQWTGRVYGTCDLEVRPCRTDCAPTTYQGVAGIPSSQWGNMPFLPVLINGEFFNLRCGRRCGDCGCSRTEEVGLPGPIAEVVEVEVDGEVIDPSSYRVDNRTWLVRTDGGKWPTCQDLNAELGDADTWAVRYRWGTPVPDGGRLAASVLSCEMAKSALGRDCELPQRVSNVNREGVSLTVLDNFEGLEAGRTGLWLVDSWVASVNRAPRRSRVLSPDTKPGRVRTS